jgi:dTDP-4-dehydrorhamnose reductase
MNPVITILGKSGYLASAFAEYFGISETWNVDFVSREQVNYYDHISLARYLKSNSTSFLINCAGFTGKPNVDACELAKHDCLQ